MVDSDLSILLLVLLVAVAAFLFPGGPGTPLRMRTEPQR